MGETSHPTYYYTSSKIEGYIPYSLFILDIKVLQKKKNLTSFLYVCTVNSIIQHESTTLYIATLLV